MHAWKFSVRNNFVGARPPYYFSQRRAETKYDAFAQQCAALLDNFTKGFLEKQKRLA